MVELALMAALVGADRLTVVELEMAVMVVPAAKPVPKIA